MPSAKTPRSSYHHGDLRAQLIAAVRELVETLGPDGFSVAQAARQAGVSSAAPYKHFKDRPELLRAVVGEAMSRLQAEMETAAARFPTGSLESVAAIGQAYVDFARAQPGVFRLMFSLTEGHQDAPDLLEKGQACFGVVIRGAAASLGLPENTPTVQQRAYMLWASVHGHSFLTIDRKTDVLSATIDDWTFLMAVSRAVLGGDGSEVG
ncbi:TetR/AcrR family transcriptional regulator [Tabrizicola piscis]|uniref:TetR/AcrR family transcriptional regulator n=1 Tax=Tabrizicola piscis TaxID=2494374 RepID=A0A3S8U3W9_9RHOB|nr:TetR/AcrR family transcriptional regulator [Tabrizicola piscis]AZL58229.1 TetR/AcrR family transcriptional regulator [Tabrizicola piscis]